MPALKEQAEKAHCNEPIRLVLVDDHFGTGTTARHAIAFLREQLGDTTRIVYFPLVSRRFDYLGVVDDVMSYSYEDPKGMKVFRVAKEEFIKYLDTDAAYFHTCRRTSRARIEKLSEKPSEVVSMPLGAWFQQGCGSPVRHFSDRLLEVKDLPGSALIVYERVA